MEIYARETSLFSACWIRREYSMLHSFKLSWSEMQTSLMTVILIFRFTTEWSNDHLTVCCIPYCSNFQTFDVPWFKMIDDITDYCIVATYRSLMIIARCLARPVWYNKLVKLAQIPFNAGQFRIFSFFWSHYITNSKLKDWQHVWANELQFQLFGTDGWF